MTDLDFIGHIGYAFIFIGMLFLASQSIWGWAFRFVGEIIWVGLGVALGLTSIWAWGFLFMCIDSMAFVNWWFKRLPEIDDDDKDQQR
jgi:hypothetical protein